MDAAAEARGRLFLAVWLFGAGNAERRAKPAAIDGERMDDLEDYLRSILTFGAIMSAPEKSSHGAFRSCPKSLFAD